MPPTAATPPLTIDAILDGLRTAGRRFPRRELQSAIAQQEAITPHLIRLLEDVARDPEPYVDDPDDLRPLAALYLLAQFRETRACQAVAAVFALPAETADLLLGDTSTERGEMILAAVCGAEPATLRALIENPDAYEYVRTAAMKALVALALHGLWPREAVVESFRSLFTERLPHEPGFVWSGLVGAALDLHPGDLLPEIRRVYDEDLIEEGFCGDFQDVEAEAARDPAEVLAQHRRSPTYAWITDVIAELEGWAAFHPDRPLRTPGIDGVGDNVRRPPAKADKTKAKKKRKMAKAARRGNR